MDEYLELDPGKRIDIFKVVSLFHGSIDSILDDITGKLTIGDWNDAHHFAPNRYYDDEYDEHYDKYEVEYELKYEYELKHEDDNVHEDKLSKTNDSDHQDLSWKSSSHSQKICHDQWILNSI